MNPESNIIPLSPPADQISADSCFDLTGLSESLPMKETTTENNGNKHEIKKKGSNNNDAADTPLVDANVASGRSDSVFNLSELNSALYESAILTRMKNMKHRQRIVSKIRKIKARRQEIDLVLAREIEFLNMSTRHLEKLISNFNRRGSRPFPYPSGSLQQPNINSHRSRRVIYISRRGQNSSPADRR